MRNPSMIDVRDEALGSALDRAAERIEAAPRDRLPEVLRKGSRRRAGRLTAIGAAVAVFVGAVSWTGLSLPSEDVAIPGNVADWRTFASLEENGWTIETPTRWRTLALPACPGAEERIGVMVTNVEFEFRDPQGGSPDCGDRLVMAGFPRDGVVLGFQPIVGDSIPGFIFEEPDTVLPLAPQLLVQTGGIRGGPAESYQGIWHDGDWIGTIRRFVGPDASADDIEALDRMLASFRVRGAPRWIQDAVAPRNELEDLEIRLTRPSDWRLATYPRWSVIDAPNPLVGLSSPAVREGRCRPDPLILPLGLGHFRDDSVLVLISDATDAWTVPDLPPRPDAFQFQDALLDEGRRCGESVRVLRFGFEAVGRQIFVDVLAPSDVFQNDGELIRYILDSIEITKA